MARSKSIPGSRTSRPKVNKEQTEPSVAVNSPEVGAAGKTVAEAAPAINAEVSNPVAASSAVAERMDGPNSGLESKAGSDARKFEVMRAEPRKNLVPINLEDEIRRRAYEIYEQRGAGAGNEADDWFAAEREVRQRYRQQSA
jgi:hypothetical protein